MDHQLVATLSVANSNDLRQLVQQDISLQQALLAKVPAIAEDAGWDFFEPEWLRRYASRILAEVSGKPLDLVYEWALGTSALQVSDLLVKHLGLNVASYAAAVALAILIRRVLVGSDDTAKAGSAETAPGVKQAKQEPSTSAEAECNSGRGANDDRLRS